jgi:hypothetical protein
MNARLKSPVVSVFFESGDKKTIVGDKHSEGKKKPSSYDGGCDDRRDRPLPLPNSVYIQNRRDEAHRGVGQDRAFMFFVTHQLISFVGIYLHDNVSLHPEIVILVPSPKKYQNRRGNETENRSNYDQGNVLHRFHQRLPHFPRIVQSVRFAD